MKGTFYRWWGLMGERRFAAADLRRTDRFFLCGIFRLPRRAFVRFIARGR
jgi:hypothetical protein